MLRVVVARLAKGLSYRLRSNVQHRLACAAPPIKRVAMLDFNWQRRVRLRFAAAQGLSEALFRSSYCGSAPHPPTAVTLT